MLLKTTNYMVWTPWKVLVARSHMKLVKKSGNGIWNLFPLVQSLLFFWKVHKWSKSFVKWSAVYSRLTPPLEQLEVIMQPIHLFPVIPQVALPKILSTPQVVPKKPSLNASSGLKKKKFIVINLKHNQNQLCANIMISLFNEKNHHFNFSSSFFVWLLG